MSDFRNPLFSPSAHFPFDSLRVEESTINLRDENKRSAGKKKKESEKGNTTSFLSGEETRLRFPFESPFAFFSLFGMGS